MDTLEQFFRFAGISQLLVLALVLVKDHRDKTGGLLVAAWAISGASYLVVVPAFRDWHWELGSYVFLVGSLSWPVLFWLVAKALFQDEFRPGWRHLSVLLAVIIVSFLSGAPAFRSGFGMAAGEFGDIVLPQSLALIFIILALYVVLRDWRSDLVESRRKLRLLLLAATGFVALASGLAVFILLGMPETQAIRLVDTIHVGLVSMLCLGTGLVFYSVPSQFIDTRTPHRPAPPADNFGPTIVELNRLTREEQVFCERGLTIGRLAAMLGEKEYRLRRIINGEFGYRNFNDFLNQHRVTEAARRLVSPDTRRLPVLTIALDVGYSSLGPFNRAFKQQFDMTPTEFRAASKSSEATSDVAAPDSG